jgi:predicted alpha/beta-hydrolase family hydrolase
MVEYATALALDGVEVVTFNFPYMDGRRGAPDRAPVLETCLRTVVDAARAHGPSVALFIGGKSMGGRMATHVAAQGLHDLRGVITLGYPLHPPGQPDRLRTAHLSDLRVPWLIVQGERDTFGSPTELAPFVDAVPGGARLVPVSGADHSLTVRREPPEVTRSHVVAEVTAWMRAQTLTAPASPVS